MFGQGGRRFVHNDGFRFAEERTGDFDDLLVGSAKIPHVALFVNGDAERIENLASLCAHGFAAEPSESVAFFTAEEHVFIDTQVVDRTELLMDEGNAVFNGFVRRMELHRLSVDDDLSTDRREKSAEDFHQSRFAGAIFAEEG